LAKRLRPGDALVMLAAVNPGRRHDEEAFLANVGMASAVCRAIRDAECAQVVYISSDAVYPFIPTAIQEHVAPLPATLYAHMHLARETMLRALESPPVTVLRLTQVYGAGDPHNAYGPTRMIRSALTEGRIVLYGSGEETRDHICVDEAVAAIVGVLTMRSRGLVNVATGRSISFADLAELVRRTCGGSIAIEHEPRRMPVLHRRFDTRELKVAFPAHVSIPLEAGIAKMAESLASADRSSSTFGEGPPGNMDAQRAAGGFGATFSSVTALESSDTLVSARKRSS
jgi:UDP-glucose 4-epimerase